MDFSQISLSFLTTEIKLIPQATPTVYVKFWYCGIHAPSCSTTRTRLSSTSVPSQQCKYLRDSTNFWICIRHVLLRDGLHRVKGFLYLSLGTQRAMTASPKTASTFLFPFLHSSLKCKLAGQRTTSLAGDCWCVPCTALTDTTVQKYSKVNHCVQERTYYLFSVYQSER